MTASSVPDEPTSPDQAPVMAEDQTSDEQAPAEQQSAPSSEADPESGTTVDVLAGSGSEETPANVVDDHDVGTESESADLTQAEEKSHGAT